MAAASPKSMYRSSPTLWASVPMEMRTPASRATISSSTSRSWRYGFASISTAVPALAAAVNTRSQSAHSPARRSNIRHRGWARTWTVGLRTAARYRSVWSSVRRSFEWNAPSTRSRRASASGSMSPSPSGDRFISSDFRSRSRSPRETSSAFAASMSASSTASLDSSMPFAMGRPTEWSVTATNS